MRIHKCASLNQMAYMPVDLSTEKERQHTNGMNILNDTQEYPDTCTEQEAEPRQASLTAVL